MLEFIGRAECVCVHKGYTRIVCHEPHRRIIRTDQIAVRERVDAGQFINIEASFN